MIYINYMNQFAEIYNKIYELLNICSCKYIPNTLDYSSLSIQIKQKINEFNTLQNSYLDVIETTFKKQIIFESVNWDKYIKFVESEYNYLNLHITFYVDYPNLNEYGIIIQERNYEKHYIYKQKSSNSSNTKITLTSNTHIIINDEIIDEIRKGQISNSGRIRISYTNSEYNLLRIPFHKERMYIENIDWINSVITSMEIEFEKFSNFSNKKNISEQNKEVITEIKNITYSKNLNDSYSKTSTCYNID